MKMFSHNIISSSPLAFRILLIILITSTIATVFIVAIQLWFEFDSDISLIQKRLDQIEDSYSDSLALSVWNFNKNQYNIQLDGILNIEDIVFVKILSQKGDEIIAKGTDQKNKRITQVFQLKAVDFGKPVDPGQVIIVASLDRVYSNLLKRAFIILVTQGIKTFIISIVILVTFHALVTRHLNQISGYAKNIDLYSDEHFMLDRTPTTQKDELDHIVFALNNMRENNQKSYHTIQELNRSLKNSNLKLEVRVRERTSKLLNSEKQLKKILDSSPLGILIAESVSMQLRYANPAICDLLGYDKIDLEMLNLKSLHKLEDLAHILEEYNQALRNKQFVSDIPFLAKDSSIFEADVITAPITLDDKDCLLGFIVDQTERKDLENRLNRAQKMEAIGMMASGVAHDLNNILSGIISYPELLLLQLPESSQLRQPLEAIQESGKRAATVVADLLTVARGAASTREPHDVNSLIQEYLKSPEYVKLKSLYPNVTCVNRFTAARSTVSCSPVHVKKCIMNLVTNSAEAAMESGTITISTENHTVDTTTSAHLGISPGDYVVINVEDTGPGISNDDLKHIFEPFYSQKVMGRSGTGLGLAVVWNTMEDHGGKVLVNSSKKGTCFQLFFSVSSEKEPLPASSENMVTGRRGNESEQILVVDDEVHLRDIASQMLENFGYNVHTVSSGEKALKFIKENKVDLIVLDMLMEPGMNGRHTYEEILKLCPDQKAVVASGFSESEDVKATLRLGAGGFIKKPYSMNQLGRAVRWVLNS